MGPDPRLNTGGGAGFPSHTPAGDRACQEISPRLILSPPQGEILGDGAVLRRVSYENGPVPPGLCG
jgi:hypothetical protein